MSYSSYGIEKGQLIRAPSTANLMLDSQDRSSNFDVSGLIINTSSPWNFSINRAQSLIQGFFTRIGTTEVVLEWCLNNISATLGNTKFAIRDNSGVTHAVYLPPSEYTAEEALDYIEGGLNALGLPGYDFSLIQKFNSSWILANIDAAATPFTILRTKLSRQLGLVSPSGAEPANFQFTIDCPDIRPYRYIDFVCSQLTAVQDVKDASTSSGNKTKDVLCRWYFSDDTPDALDAYGFPILQGYTKFVQRRIFNPPKQIKWEQSVPVGGYLQFEVYGDDGLLITEDGNVEDSDSNWLMTLQLSEG